MKKTDILKKGKQIPDLFRKPGTRHGAYSIGITVLVIAAVIVFNLIVGQIPEAYRNIDVSSTKIYDISNTTRALLDSMDKEVDMKVLAVKDDTDDRITTFLSKYAALSDKIHVEWIDPVLHPSALNEYNASENSIVISCEDTGRTTTVDFTDILVPDQYSYYYSGTQSYVQFDGEGQLTGAVNYVTNETNHTIYQMTGHGEGTLSSNITDLMEKNSYTLTDINLLMTDSVPDDCDLLLMNAPTADLSEEEAQKVNDYLGAGGKMMMLFGDTNASELTNLSGILNEYGLEPEEGYIADPQRSYQGNYYYIFPQLSVSGDMAEGISTQMVMLANAHGMNIIDPQRESIAVTGFMTTSDQAYAITENSQKQGSYTLGAVATETISSDDDSDSSEDSNQSGQDSEKTESRLTVISAGSLIDDTITGTFPQLENSQLFMNAVTANFDGAKNLSIEAKSLGTEQNTIQHTGLFSLLVIFGIPAVVLIGGFVVWIRRRKA